MEMTPFSGLIKSFLCESSNQYANASTLFWKQSELTQMKIGLKLSDNDLNIKVRKMRAFLDDGDRVKIMIIFRGREMAHKEIGSVLLDKVTGLLGDDIVIEGKPQMSGRNLSVQVRKK